MGRDKKKGKIEEKKSLENHTEGPIKQWNGRKTFKQSII